MMAGMERESYRTIGGWGSSRRLCWTAVRRGFTLVEVALAAGVLALAIATSITSLQIGFRSIDTARCTTLTAQVLQGMIEDIRLLTWAQVSNSTVLSNITDRPLSSFDMDAFNHYQSGSITGYSATAASMLTRFTFSRTVSDVWGRTDISGVSNMKKITLTAKWTGLDGKIHSVQYTTYYAQNGLYAYYST